MRGPRQKSIALFMLIVTFAMSLGAYGFNSKWLTHDLDHERQMTAAAIDLNHASQLDTQDTPGPKPLSDAEHKLLHVLNYCEQIPGSTFKSPGEPPAQIVPAHPGLLTLRLAVLESPFRPPRITSLI